MKAGTRKVRIAINCGGAGKTGAGISNGLFLPPPFEGVGSMPNLCCEAGTKGNE